MASIAKLTRTDFLESQEVDGTVVRLVTRARVVGLTDTGVSLLASALAAPGVPATGSALTGYDTLALRERNCSIVDGDPSTVDIDLIYERFDNPGQNFNAPFGGGVVGRVTASVQQQPSNVDLFGNTLSVQHTWSSADPTEDRAGETDVQGGEIQFYQAQRTINFDGVKVSSRPWLIANQLIGAVNKSPWMGGDVHEWMGVGVEWELLDKGEQNYRMSFSFQFNPETWNPTIVFIDPRTGKPPADLVEGTGFKTVRKHPEVDFERVIGARLQGA